MKKIVLGFLAVTLLLYGDEYDFDMDAIEQKPYEYSGYLRAEDKIEDRDNNLHIEGLFVFLYSYDLFRFKTSLMAGYDYRKEQVDKGYSQIDELYVESKLTQNHTFLIGKESLKWGKGYFFNPVAFFDRVKNPSEPTQAREGYSIVKYSYNKSFSTQLKNLSFDFLYLPSSESLNSAYHQSVTDKKNSNNIAARLYLLLYDTDIDIIYNYSDVADKKIGIDFSKNLEVNFEIHAEYAKILDLSSSYLFGFRYLTDSDLTIISEYFYNSFDVIKDEEDYIVTLITQKEPFDLLYGSVYFKNMINLQDELQQNKIGFTYSFKNSMDLDISYNLNEKEREDFLWFRLSWNF